MNPRVNPSLVARVEAAIGRAARATGVDFGYLMEQARAESSLNPAAKARTSSATGLYQFIDSTWLATLKRHGAAHGLGWAADMIGRAGGRYSVKDPSARDAIMALRTNPETAALMAAEHAADNAKRLETRLGRAAGATDLYLAHFLGAGGAARFLTGLAADGATAAADLLPRAARANRSIFFAKDGRARSLAEVYDRFATRFGANGGTAATLAARQPAAPAAAPPANAPPAADHRSYARAAYMMLAEFGA